MTPTPCSTEKSTAMGCPLEETAVGEVVGDFEAELPDLGNRLGDVLLPQGLVLVHLDAPYHVKRRGLGVGAAEHVERRRPPFPQPLLRRRLAFRRGADLLQVQKAGPGMEFLV